MLELQNDWKTQLKSTQTKSARLKRRDNFLFLKIDSFHGNEEKEIVVKSSNFLAIP